MCILKTRIETIFLAFELLATHLINTILGPPLVGYLHKLQLKQKINYFWLGFTCTKGLAHWAVLWRHQNWKNYKRRPAREGVPQSPSSGSSKSCIAIPQVNLAWQFHLESKSKLTCLVTIQPQKLSMHIWEKLISKLFYMTFYLYHLVPSCKN